MPLSALVLTLGPDRTEVVCRLSSRPNLHLGELIGDRLPVTLESPDVRSAARDIEALTEESGIAHVDLIGAYYEEDL